MILNLFHRYGDPADPTRASYRSICGVAFQSSLCSLRDDPTSYQTVSRNGDSLHCLVKNCGLRWCEGYHRWATSTEELLTQGFPVGPIIKARYAAAVALGQRPEDEICCSFNIQRDGRTPWKIKAAGGNTVHPQCSALCVLWTLCHVRGSGTCLSRSQSGTSTTTLSSPSKSSSGIQTHLTDSTPQPQRNIVGESSQHIQLATSSECLSPISTLRVGSQTTSAQPSASMCDTPQRLLQSPTLPSPSSATPTPRASKRRRESRGATVSIMDIATGCAGCR